MSPSASTLTPAWVLALEASFGSVERWRAEFEALGKAQGGHAGRVLLCFQPLKGRMVNQWLTGSAPCPEASVPLLEMALPGHDPTSGAAVDAFMADIDWAPVYSRYQHAVHAASAPHMATPDELPGKLLLDVRRAGVVAQAPALIEGARWRDPAKVDQWAQELPTDREVVVYCVYGHEVGQATALRLRAAGLNARFLQGGIDAWTKAGGPLADPPAP